EATRENLRNVLQATEMEKTRLARKIAEEAEKRYPTFKTLAEELGITGDNHVLTRRALAELMTYVDFNRSFTKVRNYVGLFRCRIRNKKYNHKARQALTRLTMALIGRTPIARGEEEVLFRIWLTFRREALERLAGIPVQQQG
ncbi:MAG: hypothetical protein QXD32_01655, partial [Nitrososphaerota archaeon]